MPKAGMTELSRVPGVSKPRTTEHSRVPRIPGAERTEYSRVPGMLKIQMADIRWYYHYEDVCNLPKNRKLGTRYMVL